MAKKVVATLKTSTGKSFAKVIRMVRSPKTNAYVFKEEIVPSDNVQEYLKKKWYFFSYAFVLPRWEARFFFAQKVHE